MEEQKHWVHDYETLANCFVAVFEHYKKDEKRIFVIHELRNDFVEFTNFLRSNKKNKEWHISYNGISFDSQITEYILRENYVLSVMSPEDVARHIYLKAQETIERSNTRQWAEYSERNLTITQLDVFKLNHWDNPAKRSSLKWIQYSMDWHNLKEMPIHHATEIKTLEEIHMIIDYCINDVQSTKAIMKLSSKQIALRAQLTKEYKINLYSASEPKISKELFLYFLCEASGENKYDLRQQRTHRTSIKFKDLVLPYIKFETLPFQNLKKVFEEVVLNPENTKGGFKHSIKYKGVKTDFGLGGVHGARKSGVYKSENGMLIISSDVVSYYPNLAIRNGWAPAHLPKDIFCRQYEWFFNERVKIPKSDPRNYVYKIILNSTYGLSNDKHCYLYDPEFTMRITVNGQLSLMMLYERLAEEIPGCMPLMQNTDGVEMMIPEEHKQQYMDICADWENTTKLKLEHDEYSKMIIGDVNNYIAIPKDPKKEAKCKGRFEFKNLALHKNKSFLIIPQAIYNYFVNDIPPEKYLMENRNIFDYCGGVKATGAWDFQKISVVQAVADDYKDYTQDQKVSYLKANGWEQSWDDDNWVKSDAENKEANTGINTDSAFLHSIKKHAVINREKLQKTIRYYISEKGAKISKVNRNDLREIQIEAGPWLQTDFSKYEKKEWVEYGINDKFYLSKIYNEIHHVLPVPSNQYDLFED